MCAGNNAIKSKESRKYVAPSQSKVLVNGRIKLDYTFVTRITFHICFFRWVFDSQLPSSRWIFSPFWATMAVANLEPHGGRGKPLFFLVTFWWPKGHSMKIKFEGGAFAPLLSPLKFGPEEWHGVSTACRAWCQKGPICSLLALWNSEIP